MRLEDIWKDRRFELPGTIDEFLSFLGAEDQETLERMNFSEIEQLPGVKSRNIVSNGGRYDVGREEFNWSWTSIAEGKSQKRGELYQAKGKTYDEAALKSMVTYWELITLREKQSE